MMTYKCSSALSSLGCFHSSCSYTEAGNKMINSGLTCQHINIIRTKVPKAGVSCIPNKCFYSSNTDTLLYFDPPPPSHLRTPLLSIDFSHFVFYCPLFLLFFPRLVVYLPHYSRPSAASAILCLSDFHPNTEINFSELHKSLRQA